MGGDGGVIPKNRRYLRGAGAGDKTGNSATDKSTVDPKVIKEERARGMQFCAVSNRPLFDNNSSNDNDNGNLVVCPYGRLYLKEAVVEALLERKKTPDSRLDHIRGLKDLHPVRFHLKRGVPTCPVRGIELNGQIPAVALVPGRTAKDNTTPNVVSERALTEMGDEAILEEYGPAEQRISLLPIGPALETVKEKWEAARAAADAPKKSKKKDKKKRKRGEEKHQQDPETTAAKHDEGSKKARSNNNGDSSNHKSKVLDSLFTKNKDLSEKEKADNLFARS